MAVTMQQFAPVEFLKVIFKCQSKEGVSVQLNDEYLYNEEEHRQASVFLLKWMSTQSSVSTITEKEIIKLV